MTNKLIIAAISARSYAQAAQELGYEVVTLDAFADMDTRSAAIQSFKFKNCEEGLDTEEFKKDFARITIDDDCRFIYGSLFDANPALLSWVSDRVRLIGNLPETLHTSRSLKFFSILDELNIAHPDVQLGIPDNTDGWLAKKLTGTGGTHVKLASFDESGDYFQRKIEGEPVSLLFLADGNAVKVVGFNLQLLAPIEEMPFRFAGAVSNLILPLPVQKAYMLIAHKLTTALGLRGLNSLDAVLEGDKLWILELNPRLSATFQLYPNLLFAHIQACEGVLVDLPKKSTSLAQLTLYADEMLNIRADFKWPVWVADLPFMESAEIQIAKNEPVCTVLAEAEDAIAANFLLLERVKILKGKLFHE